MSKIIILDLDGVISFRDGYFTDRYASEAELDKSTTITPFFSGVFQDILVGKKDLKEELPKVLKDWKWEGTMDDFLMKWFESEMRINEELLDLLTELKTSHKFRLIVATDNEKYKTEFMINILNEFGIFDRVYSSSELGFKKHDVEFWEELFKKEGEENRPNSIFWDDDQANVDLANGNGVKSYFYRNNEEFKSQLENALNG